jgi:hypothetical protein
MGPMAPPMAPMAPPMTPMAPRTPPAGPAGGGPAIGTGSEPAGDHDVPVEILAVIYIYNPPDREKLGTGTAAADGSAKAAGVVDPAAAKPVTPPTNPPPPATTGK